MSSDPSAEQQVLLRALNRQRGHVLRPSMVLEPTTFDGTFFLRAGPASAW